MVKKEEEAPPDPQLLRLGIDSTKMVKLRCIPMKPFDPTSKSMVSKRFWNVNDLAEGGDAGERAYVAGGGNNSAQGFPMAPRVEGEGPWTGVEKDRRAPGTMEFEVPLSRAEEMYYM